MTVIVSLCLKLKDALADSGRDGVGVFECFGRDNV